MSSHNVTFHPTQANAPRLNHMRPLHGHGATPNAAPKGGLHNKWVKCFEETTTVACLLILQPTRNIFLAALALSYLLQNACFSILPREAGTCVSRYCWYCYEKVVCPSVRLSETLADCDFVLCLFSILTVPA